MSWRSAYAIDNPSGQIGNIFYPSVQYIAGQPFISGNELYTFHDLPIGIYNINIRWDNLNINYDVPSITFLIDQCYIYIDDGTTITKTSLSAQEYIPGINGNVIIADWGVNMTQLATSLNNTLKVGIYLTPGTNPNYIVPTLSLLDTGICIATKIG